MAGAEDAGVYHCFLSSPPGQASVKFRRKVRAVHLVLRQREWKEGRTGFIVLRVEALVLMAESIRDIGTLKA